MSYPTILPEQIHPPTSGQEALTDAFLDYAGLKPRIPVCDRTLREWIRKGKIPSVKMPGSRRRLFFWKDVEAALRRHTQGGVL